jgi:aryl-alcohol dehydrogenase-like predicted oxidoreductase
VAATNAHARSLPRGRLVLGTAQFGQRYGTSATPDAPSRNEVAALLRVAEEHGIRWLDTARAYGESESDIGSARAAGVASSMRLVSKVRPLGVPRGDSLEVRDQTRAAIRASAEESLTALRADVLDVLLLHRADDAWLASGAVVEALDSLVEAGRVLRWGISVSTPAELIAALRLPGLSYVQLPFNLLDRRWLAPDVQSALAANPAIHITARSVLLQGLLTADDLSRWPTVPGADAMGIRRALVRLTSELGRADLLDLCLAYVSASTWIGSVIFGTRRTGQLLSFLEAAARPPLTPDEVRHVQDVIPPGPGELVNPALWPGTPLAPSATRWGSM